MARIFAPIHPPNDPRKCEPWLNNELRRISQALRHSSLGLAAISRGESPDGSGNPLPGPDLTNYWFKPGVASFGVAYGEVGSGGEAVISSTSHDTKGFIRLGSPTAIISVDEDNGYVGVGKTTPECRLHIRGAGIDSSLAPQSVVANSWTEIGVALPGAITTNDGDSTYIQVASGDFAVRTCKVLIPEPADISTVSNVTIHMIMRKTAATATTMAVTVDLERTSGSVTLQTISLNDIGTGYADVPYTLTPAELALYKAESHHELWMISVGTGEGNDVRITQAYVEVTSAPTVGGSDIVRWESAGSVLLGKIDSLGHVGIGTGGTAISSMLDTKCDLPTIIGHIIIAAASQSANLLQFQNSGGTPLSGFTAAGAYYLTAGAAAGKILTSDGSGVGSWASAASLATRVQYDWRALGPYQVGTEVDGQLRIPTAFTISSVYLYRRVAGSSGSTIVDVNKNGTTIFTTQANRPTVTAAGLGNQASAGTAPDVTSVAAGDILSIDIDQIEGGSPLDFTLIIEGA